jgi:hypothetical protein
MEAQALEADYLVVGSGAVGMGFVDVLMAETSASVVMVDRHHRPGGPDPRPVFEPGRVTVQCVRYLHVTLSAGLIGHLEATRSDALERNNALCRPLSYSQVPRDWVSLTLAHAANAQLAAQDQALRAWESRCRLNPMCGAPASSVAPEWDEARRRFRASVQAGMARLRELLDEGSVDEARVAE